MNIPRIAICDDIEAVATDLLSHVKTILMERKTEAECRIFFSGEDLLDCDDAFSIVFLDIEMPGMDGIEVGKELRKRNPDCKIIMVTVRIDRISEAFFFQAFRFVQKPFKDEEIREALFSAMDGTPGEKTLELYHERNVCQIKQSEIRFIRAFNGYSEFMVGNKIFRKDASLSELEEELDPRIFFRIHRQYIVNFSWIDEIQGDVLLVRGVKLPISRRRRKDVEKEFIKFDLQYGGKRR